VGKVSFFINIIWRLINLLFFLIVLDGLRGNFEKIIFSFLIIIFANQMRAIMNLHTYIDGIAVGLNNEFINLRKILGKESDIFEEETTKKMSERLEKQRKFYLLELIYQGLLYLLAVFTIFNTL
jgi:hypothetical protein